MNVFIDTNVLLSAALRNRLPEQVVLHVAMQETIRWLVTAEIMDEYVNVLQRPKFNFPDQLIQDWLGLLRLRTVRVASPTVTIEFPRDPPDAIFLAAAISNHADLLITGDNDLLKGATVATTRIVSVAEFAASHGIGTL